MGSVSPLLYTMRRIGIRTIGLLAIATWIFICVFSTRYEPKLKWGKPMRDTYLRRSDIETLKPDFDGYYESWHGNFLVKDVLSDDDVQQSRALLTDDLALVEEEIKHLKSALRHHQPRSKLDSIAVSSDKDKQERQWVKANIDEENTSDNKATRYHAKNELKKQILEENFLFQKESQRYLLGLESASNSLSSKVSNVLSMEVTDNILREEHPLATTRRGSLLTVRPVIVVPLVREQAADRTSAFTETSAESSVSMTPSLLAGRQPPDKCRPSQNLIFLKTHKTASSTVISIIQRMADHMNLSIALPSPNHHLGWPVQFEPKHVFEHEPGRTYNFICHHARFHKSRMLSVMSSPNTTIATIVRDPLFQFESGAIYLNFNHYLKLPKNVSIFETFFDLSPDYVRNISASARTNVMKLAKNPVAFDMGFDPWNETESHIEFIIDSIKRDFDFIMVADYLAESLLLLKEQLCWTMEDIAYFTMNKRPDEYRQKPSPDAREKVRRWNKLDYAIFEYANATLWWKIRQAGPRFQSDLERLQKMNGELEEKCLEKGFHRDKSQPWFPILGYQLKKSNINSSLSKLCTDMIRPEIEYTNVLKVRDTRRGWRPPTKPAKSVIPPPKSA